MQAVADDPRRAWPSRYSDIAIMAAYFDEPEIALDILLREARHTPIRFGTLWLPLMV